MHIDEQIKRQLARELCAILKGWTVDEIIAVLGVQPSRISELRHGRLSGYSITRLLRLISMLRYDIEISLRPRKRAIVKMRGATATVVRYDAFDRPASDAGG